ncbi:DUF3320 domain-containing protein [Marinobacter persicus]|uniref:AAA domain-containing protein n=1 Tax=Marinobacter persicus TaxID=930118 RepID=A0A2S6G255_9GAMM|nr:DUF3320 domain-containing protein [Marinobacter persicus]KXS53586.1 MAG: hypothetical protein AWU57_2029 [Marinobacter sp. T13-3]PPK49850.1 AAA domain-containing protein [Marinobacter persicus]PPK51287.1 AAA domain-containing protein [Marinobacter persicus]PPK55784.1 AAA domain-containing protein [Marinobacter persicus]
MSIEQKLELARMELLDMGLRGNPLLSIPKNMKFLEVVEERSDDIFRLLVENRKAMSFLPLPGAYEDDEGDEDESLPTLHEYLQETSGESRFGDRYLQTAQFADRLDTRLLKIENEAHTLLQEQGIDVLHLVLGVLEWYEDPNARTPRYAPLLLIPVELNRESARSGFSVSYTDVDLSPNLTLAAKLKGEFRVDLPGFPDEIVPSDYLAKVEKAIENQTNWKVHRDKMFLGLFSSGKFQMYMDLDSKSWPSVSPLSRNPLLGKVLETGFVKDDRLLDGIGGHRDLVEPEKLHLVKDADSSQMEALVAAMDGANLVVQGPPGTGKSQTITNLIAEAVGRGKKVLFVAQKMAALEVVKSRLDESHLGEAVLELHSHKSSKKTVLDSLKSTFQQGKPNVPDRGYQYRRLSELREHLDKYAEEISQPVLQSGVTYREALGETLSLQKNSALESINRIPFKVLKEWSREDLERGLRLLQTVEAYLQEFGRPGENAFALSTRTRLSPAEEREIEQHTENAQSALQKLQSDCDGLTDLMRIPGTETFEDIDLVHKAGQRALNAPHLEGVKVKTRDWQLRRDEVRELIALGSTLNRLEDSLLKIFVSSALEADLMAVRMGLAGKADKWWRIFSGEYRKAKSTFQGYLHGKLEGKPTEWLQTVDDALEFQKQEKRFREMEGIGQLLFGAQWQGRKSDWQVLSRISEWIFKLYDEIGNGELPEGLTDFVEANPDVRSHADQIEALATESREVCAELEELSKALALKEGFSKKDSLKTWFERLGVWSESWSELYGMVRFNQLEADVEAAGLGDILPQLREWPHSPETLSDWLKLSFYSGLVDYVYSTSDTVGRFDRVSHERMIHEFRELDTASLSYAQEQLVCKLHNELPSFNAPGEMELIRREINKKRRHIPIRRLITEAGTVIQQAKPVFMMSPMSVATYLPQGKIKFDLVIFDEASQIPAPEALGAMARAEQAVVVGDSKQMPPTNFFSKAVEVSDEDADQSVTADVESILAMMQARGAPERMLSWHYRSRHHSLIAVSNDQFYDGRLVFFPSSGANPQAKGLSFTYLPDAVYERGKTRSNPIEAKAVAQAVLDHSRNTPGLSLGVVAFSTAQREALMFEVERLRREHPETENFFRHHEGGDEFFIKNLENVQGDERDVIFISVGYGKTENGNVSQNFGPLNSKGGERRLNVLISRAKLAMRVFANFHGDDLRTGAGSPFGVSALKVFLNYAEKGDLPTLHETGKAPDSPFEVEVKQAIESLGYQVEPQVGCSGYSIDLAIVDPKKPGRYLLAVECDGASYHSSASARERDRLRQGVLEGLGWRFHRIWSTEWFRNPSQEIKRLQQVIEKTIERQSTIDERSDAGSASSLAPVKKNTQTPTITRQTFSEEEPMRAVDPYQVVKTSGLGLPVYVEDFSTIPKEQLMKAIVLVAKHEAPIHINILTFRLVEAVGLGRAGKKIKNRILESVLALERSKELQFDGTFIRLPGSGAISLRDWSDLPASQRKFDFVPSDELAEAVLITVKDARSVSREDCMGAAINLLGFKRLTDNISGRMREVIGQLVRNRLLVEVNGRLRLS